MSGARLWTLLLRATKMGLLITLDDILTAERWVRVDEVLREFQASDTMVDIIRVLVDRYHPSTEDSSPNIQYIELIHEDEGLKVRLKQHPKFEQTPYFILRSKEDIPYEGSHHCGVELQLTSTSLDRVDQLKGQITHIIKNQPWESYKLRDHWYIVEQKPEVSFTLPNFDQDFS